MCTHTHTRAFACVCGLACTIARVHVCRLEDSSQCLSLPSICLKRSLFPCFFLFSPSYMCRAWCPKGLRERSCFYLPSSYRNAVITAVYYKSTLYRVSGGLNWGPQALMTSTFTNWTIPPSACFSILDDEEASVTATHAHLVIRGVLTHSDISAPFSISICFDGLLKLVWLGIHLSQ